MSEVKATLSVCHPHGYEIDSWGFSFLESEDDIFFRLGRFVITEIRPGFSACCILLTVTVVSDVEPVEQRQFYVWRDDQGLFRKL